MAEQEREPRRTDTPPEEGRRPYERPRILHREPLEVVAGICTTGKAAGQSVQCNSAPNS